MKYNEDFADVCFPWTKNSVYFCHPLFWRCQVKAAAAVSLLSYLVPTILNRKKRYYFMQI